MERENSRNQEDESKESDAKEKMSLNSSEENRRKTLEYLKMGNKPLHSKHNQRDRKDSTIKRKSKSKSGKTPNWIKQTLGSGSNYLASDSETRLFGPKKIEKPKEVEVDLTFEPEFEEEKRERRGKRRNKEFEEDNETIRKSEEKSEAHRLKILKEEKSEAHGHKILKEEKSEARRLKILKEEKSEAHRLRILKEEKLAQRVLKLHEEIDNEEVKPHEHEPRRHKKSKGENNAKGPRKLSEEMHHVQNEKSQGKSLIEIHVQDDTEMKAQKDKEPPNISGYRPRLFSSKRNIFEAETGSVSISFDPETELKDMGSEKDMTWLVRLSSNEEEKSKPEGYFETKIENSAETPAWLFWFFILIGGRMPFHFVKNSDTGKSKITCEMKKNSHRFYAFVISTLFLIFLTVVSFVNLLLIVGEEEVKGEPHNQLEKLLFSKNKVTAIIFLASLTMASISSINVLIYGDSIAKYINLLGKTFDEFNFNSTSGILTVTIIYIVWSISVFLIQVIIFSITISEPKPNPLIEGTHLLTALIFRSFVPKVLIEFVETSDNHQLGIQSSSQLWKYGAFIVCLNSYVLYCAWNFIIMVVLHSIGITNMAAEWNFRLRLIFQQTEIKENEHFLLNLAQSQNYQKMFDWHRKIVLLVQEHSKVFCTILVAFYLTVSLALFGEVLDVAIDTVGQEALKFSLNETEQIYDFEKNSADVMYVWFHLSQTIGIFLFISLLLAQTGIEIMNGLIPVTRHNYMNMISTHRRNFFMSLSMSFSPRKPHLLGAGGIFAIDRPFIFGFLAFFMYVFSVMIQIQHQRILTLPIVLECPPKSGNFCVSNKLTTMEDVANVNTANDVAAAKALAASKKKRSTNINPGFSFPLVIVTTEMLQSTTETTSPTTTTISTKQPGYSRRNDSCNNVAQLDRATNTYSPQKAVMIPIGNMHYIMCCYDYGDQDLNTCNQKTAGNIRNNCKIGLTGGSKELPFALTSLDRNLKGCFTSVNAPTTCPYLDECICGNNPTVIVPPQVGRIRCPNPTPIP